MKGASNFKEAMRMGAEIYQNLKKVVKKKYGIDGKFNLFVVAWGSSDFCIRFSA